MQDFFKSLSSVLALALILASCTNIDIREEDAFDVKRTIDPRYFESSDYSLEEIRFAAADGLELEGWFISRAGNERTVLFIGGNGFVIAASYYIITSIIEQDVDLMVFNFRGYGTNPGSPTVEGVKADVEGAYRYLTEQRGVPPAELILHGHSLGSILAAGAANRHPVAAVVLESPLTDAKDLTSRLVPWILKPFVRFTVDPALLTVSNYEEVPKITVPVLFITGGADNVTPQEMAEELYDAAETDDKRLHILQGGGHNDLPEREDYRKLLREFYHNAPK
ncbi:MAG: alpha/beta hydrolase [Sediminispirochaetaceae bacterium]